MENLDLKETSKFEALAREWWDKEGKCRPLHDLNPSRLQFIVDRCPIEGQSIIDIGCGAGILSESLAKRGGLVTGIDAAPALIEVAIMHARENNLSNQTLNYEVATAEDYAKQGKSFDIVTCMELIEHVPDPISLIKACAKLLKPDGHLFLSTLNRTPKSFLLAIIGADYILNLLPKNTHQHSKFIRPSELAEALRQSNLSLEELAGLQYNPFTRQCSLTHDVSVNYLAHARCAGINGDIP